MAIGFGLHCWDDDNEDMPISSNDTPVVLPPSEWNYDPITGESLHKGYPKIIHFWEVRVMFGRKRINPVNCLVHSPSDNKTRRREIVNRDNFICWTNVGLSEDEVEKMAKQQGKL